VTQDNQLLIIDYAIGLPLHGPFKTVELARPLTFNSVVSAYIQCGPKKEATTNFSKNRIKDCQRD